MGPRTWIAALLGLGGLALALWLAAGSRPRGGVEAGRAASASPPEAPARLAPARRAEPPAESPPAEPEREPAPGAGTEVAAAPAAPPVPESALYHGRLIDQESGAPLGGARIEFGGSGSVQSDAAGRFALPAPENGLDSGRACLAGYGDAVFVFDALHPTPAEAETIELQRGATLEVSVTRADGTGGGDVEVLVTRPGIAAMRGGMAMVTAEAGRWVARTDPRGLALFEGLPAELALTWTAAAGEPVARDGKVALAPGEWRRLDLVLGGDAAIQGRVRDAGGVPAAGVTVLLERAGENRAKRIGMGRASCDTEGEFRLEGIPYGRYALRVLPEEESGLLSVRSTPLEVDCPLVTLDLEVVRGAWIEGTVVGPPDEVAALTGLRARPVEGTDTLSAKVEDGRFRIGPCPPGWYDVAALGRRGRQSAVVRAQPGDTVELPLVSAATVRVRLIGASGEVEVLVVDLKSDFATWWNERDDRIEKTLVPGTYAVWAWTPSGLVGAIPRLEVPAGADGVEETLVLARGAELTLVHAAPAPTGRLRLEVGGVPLPEAVLLPHSKTLELLPGGALTLRLPADPFTAELWTGAGLAARASVLLAPGERRRIRLER